METCRQQGYRRTHGGILLQLFRGLPLEGALLGPLFLLLILQPLGYPNVILHKLVLLDISGVVLLNYGLKQWQSVDDTRAHMKQ